MDRRASTTGGIRGPGRRRQSDRDEFDVELDFPMEHTRAHGALLDSTDPAAVHAWQEVPTECAQLRCSYASDRVSEADLPAADVLPMVEAVLNALLAPPAGGVDVPAVATIVGTMEPPLAALPSRSAALTWHDRWLPRLRDVGRCDRAERDTASCPGCRRGQACPLDAWPRISRLRHSGR